MPTTKMMTIKLLTGGAVYRVELLELSIAAVQAASAALGARAASFTYVDDENDTCTVSDDKSLRSAMNGMVATGKLPRLTVVPAPAPAPAASPHIPVMTEAPQVQGGGAPPGATAAPALPSAAPQPQAAALPPAPAAPPLTDGDVFEALDIVRALLAQAQGTRHAVRRALATVPGVFPTALALYSNLLAGATGVASAVTAAVRSGLVLPLVAALAEASHRWAETLAGPLRPYLLRAGISPTDLDAALALGLAQAPQAGPWVGGRGHGRGHARWAPAAPAPAAPAAAPVPVAAAAGPAVHADVTCDACGVRPLTGARFKCAVCADFDLCEACEASNAWGGGGAAPGVLHERTHPFLKIAHPIQTPTAIRIVLAEAHEAGLPAGSAWAAGGGGGGGRWGWGHGRGHGHGHGRRHWAPEGGAWGDRAPPGGGSEAAPLPAGREAKELAAALRASLAPAPAAAAPAPIAIPSTPPPRSPAAVAGFEHVAPSSPLGTPSSPAPSQLPFNARFIAHLTLSNAGDPAAKVTPGQAIVKAWRVKNDGPSAWPPGCRLVCVGGGWAAMGGPEGGLDLPPTPPGTTVDVALPLVAPDAPGRCQSYWRIQAPAHPAEAGGAGPDGARLFGARLWVDLFVEGTAATPVPASVPAPAPAPSSSVLGALAAMRTALESAPATPGAPPPAPWDGSSAAWTASLASLSAMGFADTQAAVAALAAAGGSLEGAVSALVAANEGGAPTSEPSAA